MHAPFLAFICGNFLYFLFIISLGIFLAKLRDARFFTVLRTDYRVYSTDYCTVLLLGAPSMKEVVVVFLEAAELLLVPLQ